MGKIKLPEVSGWYWVRISGYNTGTPCLFSKGVEGGEGYFLPAGLGDESRDGLYADDIEAIGPEIIEPEF
jgi:hypothetical protein